MPDSILSVYSSLSEQVVAGGCIIVGALSCVAAGIAVLKLAEKEPPILVVFLAGIGAIQLAATPAILLIPGMYRSSLAGVFGVIYLVYIAAVMIKVGTLFPMKTFAALRQILAPWFFAILSITAGSPSSRIMAILLEELLRTGLVCFTAFWLTFPLFFFSRGNTGGIRPVSGKRIFMFLLIMLTTSAGLYLVYHAWESSRLARFLDIESSILASGVLFQIADEILTFRRLKNRM